MTEFRLCRLADLPPEGARGFVIREDDGFRLRLFVVGRAGRLYAYRNACPHRHIPLDFDDGRFFNAEGTLLLCTNHGALFRLEDGLCVAGPCKGASLAAVPLRIAAGEVFAAL